MREMFTTLGAPEKKIIEETIDKINQTIFLFVCLSCIVPLSMLGLP